MIAPPAAADPSGAPCRSCAHYWASELAYALRGGLEGYGYCKAAPDALARARFFRADATCWLSPVRWREKPKTSRWREKRETATNAL